MTIIFIRLFLFIMKQVFIYWKHKLGFHGNHWQAFWLNGNVFTECLVCGAFRQLSPEDAALIPPSQIVQHSKFYELKTEDLKNR